MTLASQAGLPAIVASVDVPGQGRWQVEAGLADRATNEPVSVDSKFAIGSITKTFTATSVLLLVDNGLLDLTAPLSNWQPTVQNADQITVQMLLNMTSGIYDEGGPGSTLSQQLLANPTQTFTPQQIVDWAIAQGPHSAPGTVYYSDTNYVILGMIVEAITGQSIGDFITENILTPTRVTPPRR